MAASTTCPLPERFASSRPHTSPEREIEPAAAEVPDEVEGGDGRTAPCSYRVQRPGEGDVVDVVPGRVGDGTFLAPTRHPAVDEAGVAGEAYVGADAEALRHSGAKAFDETVRLGHEPEDRLASGLGFHVDRDRAPAAVEEIETGVALHPEAGVGDPIHADDVRAHVREHHRAHRPGADPGELDNPETCERTHTRHLLAHSGEWGSYLKLPEPFGSGPRRRSTRLVRTVSSKEGQGGEVRSVGFALTVCAHTVDDEAVVGHREAGVGRDLPLALLDGLVDELRHPAAAHADQVVVMLAGGQLENRRAAVEVVTDDEPGLLELGQHPVHGREANRFSARAKPPVDVLRGDVQVAAVLENFEDPKSRQCRLQPGAFEVGGLHVPFSSERRSRPGRLTPGEGKRKSEIALRMGILLVYTRLPRFPGEANLPAGTSARPAREPPQAGVVAVSDTRWKTRAELAIEFESKTLPKTLPGHAPGRAGGTAVANRTRARPPRRSGPRPG